MMWNYGSGGGGSWLWMMVIMLAVWSALIVAAVWAVRARLGSGRQSVSMDVLRHRLATGEISQDEFEKTRRILQG